MQNLFSDFRIFIYTGYFSCAFGLLFVYGLLPLVSVRSVTLRIYV